MSVERLCLYQMDDLTCQKPAGHEGKHDSSAWPWVDRPLMAPHFDGWTDEQVGRLVDTVLPTKCARTIYSGHPIVIEVCDKLDRLIEVMEAHAANANSTGVCMHGSFASELDAALHGECGFGRCYCGGCVL